MPYIHVLNAWNCGANETGPVPRAPAVRSSILKPRKSPARFSNFPGFTKQSSSPFSFSSQLHKSKNHAPQPPHGERLAVIASPPLSEF